MAVETVRAPLGTFALVLRVDSTPRGQARWSPLPRGQKRRDPCPKGCARQNARLRGPGEPGTLLVGPDWAVATLTIILGGLRLMSFNSYLMGTIILVPDSSLRACGGVG
jgi:hypothetical protein